MPIIVAQVVDYSEAYPNCVPGSLGEVTYAQLKSGSITINGKKVPTAGLSSYVRAKEIATTLKNWIETGAFLLTQPVAGAAFSGFRDSVQTPHREANR